MSTRPIVSLEKVEGTGGLSSIDIRVALGRISDKLKACHAESLARGRDIRKTVTITMDVREGKVEAIDAQPTLGSPELWSCLRRALVTAHFPTTITYAEVTLTLRVGRV